MSGFVLKAGHRPLKVELDWSRGYLKPRERVTADLGWSVQPQAGRDDPTVAEQAHDAERSWAVFSGGVPGRFYMVSHRVRTTDDRVLSRAIVLRIAMG